MALAMTAWFVRCLLKGLATGVIEAPKSGSAISRARHPRVFRLMVWMYLLLIAMFLALAIMTVTVTPAAR